MKIVSSAFTTYELTPQEELQAPILNNLNIAFIQNALAAYAADRLRLQLDPEHPLLFAQTEADLKGRIETLQWLLDSSKVASEVFASLNSSQQG